MESLVNELLQNITTPQSHLCRLLLVQCLSLLLFLILPLLHFFGGTCLRLRFSTSCSREDTSVQSAQLLAVLALVATS